MTNGFSRSPRLLKGALVELTEPFLGPMPKIIVFQYNPVELSRDLTPWSASVKGGGTYWQESTGQPFDPGESFSLDLILDASDALEQPERHPVAVVSGIADRIAALEMLLYPIGESLLGESFAKAFGEEILGEKGERGTVPVVLFIWGPGRIVPVRLTSFKVTEEAFSPTLYPLRATVSIGLQVLTAESFKSGKKDENGKPKLSASEQIAVKAYEFTRGQKEVLARTNLANSFESVLGQVAPPSIF